MNEKLKDLYAQLGETYLIAETINRKIAEIRQNIAKILNEEKEKPQCQ